MSNSALAPLPRQPRNYRPADVRRYGHSTARAIENGAKVFDLPPERQNRVTVEKMSESKD
jgi:hypothetical protein